jgi:hypothetical protein
VVDSRGPPSLLHRAPSSFERHQDLR